LEEAINASEETNDNKETSASTLMTLYGRINEIWKEKISIIEKVRL